MEALLTVFVLIGVFVFFGRRDGSQDDSAKPETGKSAVRQERQTESKRKTPAAPASKRIEEKVVFGRVYVTDGDGLRIKGEEIRLFGIDAPEFNHPFGKKAKWTLLALCKGQDVMAISAERDHHDRLVARCFLADGRDLSAEMVKLGLALDWPKFSGGMYGPFETSDARKKLWLADARQKGHMHVWEKFEAQQQARKAAKVD